MGPLGRAHSTRYAADVENKRSGGEAECLDLAADTDAAAVDGEGDGDASPFGANLHPDGH